VPDVRQTEHLADLRAILLVGTPAKASRAMALNALVKVRILFVATRHEDTDQVVTLLF
jgi:hypothetical protein